MTLEELEKQIASLQEEVRKLKETKSAEPWRAAKGGWYYYIDSDGTVIKDLEDYSEVHLHRFQLGNYYRCGELAHQDANKLRVRNRIRQLHEAICEGYQFAWGNCNWFIRYSDEYQTDYSAMNRIVDAIYFDTKEHAQQVCDILNAELKQKGTKNADS